MDADGFVRIADFGLCKEGKNMSYSEVHLRSNSKGINVYVSATFSFTTVFTVAKLFVVMCRHGPRGSHFHVLWHAGVSRPRSADG